MILDLHPQIRIEKLTVGAEQAPLLVIDNFVAEPERLVRRAASRNYTVFSRYYPGVRSEAPLAYQQLFAKLQPLLFDYFGLRGSGFRFAMCHYSLVTTPGGRLEFLQRIPHIDSVEPNGLASVHYLFQGNLGGTAFYRHRKTGFESIDAARRETYFQTLETEKASADSPEAAYINGDTPLFEQTASVDGVFNRLVLYRRNLLHSGSIPEDFTPDPDPRTGRLSINTFIDVVP